MAKRKTLQEIAIEKGKLLLIENSSIAVNKTSIEILKKPLTEKVLFEGVSRTFEAYAILRDVPVTKFTENLNGRIYPYKLWEKILRDNSAEGTFALADHPEEGEGSVKDLAGVWHNFRLTEELGFADLYLFGEHGKRIYEAIMAGGRPGLSSVGYGELERDGKTVQYESYELVRLGDIVLDPSQQVYATAENVIPKMESRKDFQPNVTNKFTTRNTNSLQEGTGAAMLNKLEEKNMRNRISTALKEAKSAINHKSLEEAQKAKDFIESLIDQVPEELILQKSRLEEAVQDIELLIEDKLDEQKLEFSKLKSNHEIAKKALSELKERYTTAQEVIKSLGGTERNPKNLRKLQEMKHDIQCFIEDRSLMERDLSQFVKDRSLMEKDMSRLMSDRKLMEKDISLFEKSSKLMEKDINQLVTDRKLMESDISKLVEERRLMEKDLSQLLRDRKLMERDIKYLIEDTASRDNDLQTLMSERKIMESDIANFADDRETMEADINQLLTDRETMENDLKQYEYNEKRLRTENAKLLATVRVLKENLESAKPYNPENVDEYGMYAGGAGYPTAYPTESGEGEFGVAIDPALAYHASSENLLESRKRGTGSFITESKKRDRDIKSEIASFYEKEARKHPALRNIQEKVLSAKDLIMATRIIDSYVSKENDRPLRESTSKVSFKSTDDDDWLAGRF